MERGGLPQDDVEKREKSRDSQKELVPAGGTITHPRFTEWTLVTNFMQSFSF